MGTINEHERRILEAMERSLSREDPRFAQQLAGGPSRRSRQAPSAARAVFEPPVMVAVGVLAIILFAVNVSALGFLLVLWLLAGWAHHFVGPSPRGQERSDNPTERRHRRL